MQTRVRFELILILAVVALATALRFYALDHSSLWSDEGNTWALVQRPFAQIARNAAADIHPPGYYWALKVWTALWGTSAWALRSFSAVAGVLLVVVIAHRMDVVDGEGHPVQLTWRALLYYPWLFWQIILSNIAVLRLVLGRISV